MMLGHREFSPPDGTRTSREWKDWRELSSERYICERMIQLDKFDTLCVNCGGMVARTSAECASCDGANPFHVPLEEIRYSCQSDTKGHARWTSAGLDMSVAGFDRSSSGRLKAAGLAAISGMTLGLLPAKHRADGQRSRQWFERALSQDCDCWETAL
jgi:hypothetical protein